jgi:undecaprenyl-diphosphatase
MIPALRKLLSTVREQGWWLLVAVTLIGGALLAFAELIDEVEDGETHEFDRAVLLFFRDADDPSRTIGPQWLEFVARDITALGGTAVLVLITVAAIGFMALSRKWGAALFTFVSIVGGTLISTGLKHVIDRARPDVVPHLVEVSSASFPSGHSMLSMTTYLTLGALLAEVQDKPRFKFYILAWALGIALLVGWSRMFLGVHWPTDVLGGWCVGSAWALICGTAAYWLQRRGLIEPEGHGA